MEETKYYCAVCNSVVTVIDNQINRTCEHTESTIVAEMEAVAYGESKVV